MSIRDQIKQRIRYLQVSKGHEKFTPDSENKVITEIEALIPTWTKVEDGLPEKSAKYWVIIQNIWDGKPDVYLTSHYHLGRWSGIPKDHNVTHWQPITPPSEEV